MARFAITVLCTTAMVALAIGREVPSSSLKYGMSMVTTAYDAVCWYETLKQFPKTDTNAFTHCTGQALAQQKDVENPNPTNKNYMNFADGYDVKLYSQNMDLNGLPAVYSNKCNKYLKDEPEATPTSDESDALNQVGKYDYPFKALAYCLMSTLREQHGEKAIEAVKNERTHKLKHWMNTLLDRENEFRARHGAPPLQLSKQLMDAAQQWADKNAAACKSKHVAEGDPRGQLNGQPMGESMADGGEGKDPAASAYVAADGWYEENKDYPWPAYKGNNNDAKFHKIGHFTQSVWKGSQYVGYGYAYNDNCSPPAMKRYIVARYFPAGNMLAAYGDNVAPAQD